MSALIHSVAAHVGFAVFLLAFAWKPWIVGITACVVLTFTGCVEASHGRMHTAIPALCFAVLYGVLPFAFWWPKPKPRDRRAEP